MGRRFYGSAVWRAIADRVRLARNFTCELCGAKDARHVDHIVPRREGGSDRDENLQLLCSICHSRKTATRDGGFGNKKSGKNYGPPGCDESGRPNDPDHWWNA